LKSGVWALVGFVMSGVSLANDDIESHVESMLSQLTLEQKVGQMVQAEIRYVTPVEVGKYQLGAVLNGGGAFPNNEKHSSVQDWIDLADAFYRASRDTSNGGSGIPVLWGTDAVHGHNNVMGATIFPHNIGLGAANDEGLIRRIGAATAREVAATGIDWTFAPTLAVVKDLRWGRSYESYSSQSALVARYAKAIVEGIQGNAAELHADDTKVLATAKHYIGDGGTNQGIDRGDTRVSLDELLDQHGQGYVSAIDAGVQTVMASYNSWNGDKVHGSKFLLTDVLKEQMGFDGIVVSDWDAVEEVNGCSDKSCAKAINAGVDMIMVPENWKALLQNTIRQVKGGEIPMSRIDDAVRRILRVKVRAGMFAKAAPSERSVVGGQFVGHPDHRAIAREAVRKSLVLMKNDGGLLPLFADQNVLVAGDGAHNIGKQSGGWSVTWQGTETSNADFPGGTSIYDGIRGAVVAAGGTTRLSEDGSYDVRPDVAIIVFGEEPYAEGEGDVNSLEYQAKEKNDLALLNKLRAAGIPVVSVFLSGRPMLVDEELDSSDAFVAAWLPGSEGGGVADVLFRNAEGQIAHDFSGKLSFDWPRERLSASLVEGPAEYLRYPTGFGLRYSTTVSAIDDD
jgi:beta-glucosidase